MFRTIHSVIPEPGEPFKNSYFPVKPSWNKSKNNSGTVMTKIVLKLFKTIVNDVMVQRPLLHSFSSWWKLVKNYLIFGFILFVMFISIFTTMPNV